MNRILVPTDFSDISSYGLETAVGLAKKMDAQLFLLNIIPNEQGINFSATGASTGGLSEEARYIMELRKVNEQKLAALAKKHVSSGVHITTSIVIDSWQDGISNFIDEYNVDLVIMGTSGESTYSEYFVGNHTEQVIRISHCPVLSLKKPWPNLEIKNIVLATDLNPEAFEGVTHVKRFASYFNAHLFILHVMKDKNGSNAEVSSKLDSFAHRHHFSHFSIHTIKDENERHGILRFAKEKKADLIATITHGRTGLANIIFGSLSEDLVKEANIPVLTAHISDV